MESKNTIKNFEELVCPHCGGHIALPKVVGIKAEVVGTKGESVEVTGVPVNGKYAERLIKLQQAGFNTAGYFSLTNASGESVAMKLDDNNIPVVISDEEFTAWELKIKNGGTIRSGKLWRRWVMSQMFNLLRNGGYYKGFTANLHGRGYNYQWEMLVEEFRMQVKLQKKDPECFKERNYWYNKYIVMWMLGNHIRELVKYFKTLKVKKCKRQPYVTTSIGYIFVDEWSYRAEKPIQELIDKVERADENDIQLLYDVVKAMTDRRRYVQLPWTAKQDRDWVDAFKGYGAYYTLQNLILFHGCKVNKREDMRNETSPILCTYSGTEAWDFVKEYAAKGNRGGIALEGYELLAFMNQVIKDNNFDFGQRMEEIYANKKNK